MDKLILFIFSSAGLSWILVRAKIFKPLREWLTKKSFYNTNKLSKSIFTFLNSIFNCEGCMGFYAGSLNYLLIYKDFDVIILAYGFAGSICSLLILAIISFLNRK